MTRKEAIDRFNALPIEHRTTVIAYYCEEEIRLLEREKRALIEAHKKNMNRINERIKSAEKQLKDLN